MGNVFTFIEYFGKWKFGWTLQTSDTYFHYTYDVGASNIVAIVVMVDDSSSEKIREFTL